jgi:hypothetical protein
MAALGGISSPAGSCGRVKTHPGEQSLERISLK